MRSYVYQVNQDPPLADQLGSVCFSTETSSSAAAGGGREPGNRWSRDSTLQPVGRREEDKESRAEREMGVKAKEESGGGGTGITADFSC